MTINYWSNFSKRINSTKQPTGAGTSVTCRLKEPCSVERPVFQMATIPTTANYVKWGNNYYYVTGITYITKDIIEISCELDVLATFKSNITATKAFIEYSDHDYNAYILDPRISNTSAVVHTQTTSNLVAACVSAGGCYILTVVSDDGVAAYYALTRAALNALGTYISTTMTDTVADAFVKKYGNVMGCILNCIWVPYDYPYSGETLKIGDRKSVV